MQVTTSVPVPESAPPVYIPKANVVVVNEQVGEFGHGNVALGVVDGDGECLSTEGGDVQGREIRMRESD